MRFVDHDPGAARLAATRCREAADELRRAAVWFEQEPRRVTWCGGAREALVAEGMEVGDVLRGEASDLDRTADLLEVSARDAERAEAEAWDRYLSRPRVVIECAPTGALMSAR